MDNLEKIERLSTAANVSQDEARKALELNNWDLLDAIVYLEKEGRTEGPNSSFQSTDCEEMPPLPSVQKVVDENQKDYEEKENKKWTNIVYDFIRFNSFNIRNSEKIIIKIPVWVGIILLLVGWRLVIAVMIFSLFFGIRYSFSGKDDMHVANDILDDAGNFADKVKKEFKK